MSFPFASSRDPAVPRSWFSVVERVACHHQLDPQSKAWSAHLRTAVAGNASCILAATLILANNINSSTRLLVSRCCFCSTSIGSALSDESRWIFNSAEERDKAPARIRPSFSLTATVLSSRIEVVNGSLRDLLSVFVSGGGRKTHLSSLRSWAAS